MIKTFSKQPKVVARRKKVILRLEKQYVEGTKREEKDIILHLTEADNKRINKELVILKERI